MKVSAPPAWLRVVLFIGLVAGFVGFGSGCATIAKRQELRARLEHLRLAYLERAPERIVEITAPDWNIKGQARDDVFRAEYAEFAQSQWRQIQAVEDVRFRLKMEDTNPPRAQTSVLWKIIWRDATGARREIEFTQWHEWVDTESGWLLVSTTNYQPLAKPHPWN